MIRLLLPLLILATVWSCKNSNSSATTDSESPEVRAQNTVNYEGLDTATFAGGCFWCVEASFEQIEGVEAAVSGYAGGEKQNPSYEEVSRGETNHAETVQVYYDPTVISYETLLDIFFTAHDPTQLNRQGPDVGKQYRSIIFYHNDAQLQAAKEAIASINHSGEYDDPVVTKLNSFTKFWPAEEYHQNYEERNPNDRYIQQVSKPKIEKVARKFSDKLKK